jgi:osmotically-inducible protein OsmY
VSNEISEKPEIESSLALASSILPKVLHQDRSATSEDERNKAMTDLELKKSVETELSWEPSVNAAEIGVGVKDGVVSLTGRIESYWERSVAERAALRVSGVKGVANELEIRLPFANARSDEDIARAAINRLDWSVTVPKDRVKVKVSQGWLTLEGTLDWQFQREAAADAVRNLMGVKGLTNQIDVKPQVSKAEVKSMIEAALKRSAVVDASRITVQTEGDGVILRGTVRSWSEREEAQQAAWRAPGVRSVDNRITIGAAAAAGV